MGAYLGEPLGAGDLYPHPSSALTLLCGPVCSLLPELFFKLTLRICQDSFDCPKRPKHWRVIRTRAVQTEPHFKQTQNYYPREYSKLKSNCICIRGNNGHKSQICSCP